MSSTHALAHVCTALNCVVATMRNNRRFDDAQRIAVRMFQLSAARAKTAAESLMPLAP